MINFILDLIIGMFIGFLFGIRYAEVKANEAIKDLQIKQLDKAIKELQLTVSGQTCPICGFSHPLKLEGEYECPQCHNIWRQDGRKV